MQLESAMLEFGSAINRRLVAAANTPMPTISLAVRKFNEMYGDIFPVAQLLYVYQVLETPVHSEVFWGMARCESTFRG